MRLIYNGIDMQAQETMDYRMESVFDESGVDYLYTRHTLIARCIVNGQVEVFLGEFKNGRFFRNGPPVTYNFINNNDLSGWRGAELRTGPPGAPIPPSNGGPVRNGLRPLGVGQPDAAAANGPPPSANGLRDSQSNPIPPGAFYGIMPNGYGLSSSGENSLIEVVPQPNHTMFTLQAIRHRLTAPGGRLFIFAGGLGLEGPISQVTLMSPLSGCRCDSNNGPRPRILNVVSALGDANTLIVDFAVETFVNEAPQNGVPGAGALLSNRFSQTHHIDDSSLTTVQTEGTAIFRTDAIYFNPSSPDERRPILFMPIPRGFIRGDISIQGLSDATGVKYSYIDKQVPVNFVAGPYIKAAKISAVHRQALTSNNDILAGALSTYERLLSLRANKNIAGQGGRQRTVPARAPESGAGSAIIPTGPGPVFPPLPPPAPK